MKKFFLNVLACVLLGTGCSQNGNPSKEVSVQTGQETPVQNQSSELAQRPEPSVELAAARWELTGKLFAVFQAQAGKKNFACSPYSLELLLLMLQTGSQGQTAQVLQPYFPENSLNWHGQLWKAWPQDAQASWQWLGGNSLWYQAEQSPKADYLNKLKQELQISSGPLEASAINQWVNEKTKGLIPQIIEELPPNALLILCNALYFKANWAQAFEPENTRPASFHLGKKQQIQVPTMYGKALASWEGQKAEGVCLAYQDPNLLFWVFTNKLQGVSPYQPDDQDLDFEPKLEEVWQEVLSNRILQAQDAEMEKLKISYDDRPLSLPKFELNSSWLFQGNDTKNPLSKLGLHKLFSSNADFSNMFENQAAHLSYINQKAFIKIDETGTTAAAASSAGVVTRRATPPFLVNRPFIYCVYDKQSQTLIFAGQVYNPLETNNN